MSLGPSRWHVIAESNFAWEREALEWLRAQLPDREPWHVWTNFEFIDDQGKVNEVDALALTPAGLFVIEIKSRPGVVAGDAHTWTWTTDGHDLSVDNPLLLTDRKSKRLASLLRRQSKVIKAKTRLPYFEPVVFLSSTSLRCKLQGLARSGVFQRGRPDAPDDDGIVGALSRGVRHLPPTPVDAQQARAIALGLAEAGIRPSNKHRQVGDYRLIKLIAEGESHQDWQASHVSIATVQRRVRIYTLASATSPEARAQRVRQARREFQILDGIEHSGILRCREYKDTELGPALVFDHDPRAVRLDHLLRDHGQRLNLTQRLQLVRDIAEVLNYAHSRRLFHRALGPQSILVRGAESGDLKVQLMSWQTGARGDLAGSGSTSTLHRTAGTQHVEDYVDNPDRVYLAPETTLADPAHGAELDVFSLGCLTFHIFSGQPPATSALELSTQLRQNQGLRLSDVLDGCSLRLHELVQYATQPDVLARYDSIRGFLDDLDRVEDELTAPDPETTADPSQAGTEDRIEGGFTVIKRMGRGSSSDALLVRQDGSDEALVLKVAIDASHNDNLAAEAEALAKLRHPNIVEVRQSLTVAGRTALLLKSAGDVTLAQLLRKDGRLSLDMLQRFGEELIDAVRHLEDAAVVHRDIKPDNIGIAASRTGRLKLVLFDFSLTRSAADQLSAGTPPYLDPFLALRPQRRWDLYAERFATAVTLYEMAIGKPPVWGDGRTAPDLLQAEASIAAEVFDPVVREPLAAFFSKALRRDFLKRFDNAEDMLRAWRAAFDRPATLHPPEPQGFEAIAVTATAATTMAELGYSLEAQAALETMGVHNARELLAVGRVRYRTLRGVGDRVRKEIQITAKDLARLRPDLSQGRNTLHDADADPQDDTRSPVTVNELADALLPRRPAGDDRPDDAALAHYLGLDDVVPAGTWPTLGDSALATGIERSALTAVLLKARERWLKNPAFTALRDQVEALLATQGQVMTVHEAALALLALRGCAQQQDAERLRLACAVVRAAMEAESQLDKPRFELFEHPPVPLIAVSAAWGQHARRLGDVADACALADPLMPPARVLDALLAIIPPEGLAALGDPGAAAGQAAAVPASAPSAARLLRLATMASSRAALSSRQEIYPRGMPALQALKQSLGALVGATVMKPRELQDRVQGRYPEAQALPPRPMLDRLLEEACAPLVWDDAAADGDGAYRRLNLDGAPAAGTTTRYTRNPTRHLSRHLSHPLSMDGSTAGFDALVDQARQVEDRLQLSLRQGGLLALTAEPRLARYAEAELLRRFGGLARGSAETSPPPLQRLSIDALLLRLLKDQASALGVDWAVVLRADAAPPDSGDGSRLMQLVQRTVPALQQALLHSPGPLLVVNAGLLARYGLMSSLSALEAQAGRSGCTPTAWLLLPTHRQGVAAIDGTAVPLVNPNAVITLPEAWINNSHRATATA